MAEEIMADRPTRHQSRHAHARLQGGLYDPALEHDACGIGLICKIDNEKSHDIIARGLEILRNLEHRGAVGADPEAGDGCGILIQLPDAFFRQQADQLGFTLPEAGRYGVAFLFLPRDERTRATIERKWEEVLAAEGLSFIGWRDVPVDSSQLGVSVKDGEPVMRQLFIGAGGSAGQDVFERKLFVARKLMERFAYDELGLSEADFYVPSSSSRTIVYKALVLADRLDKYFPDLADEAMASALALVHQRFSTNTFPSFPLVHPFRMICHNGEINTMRGNVNWMAARRQAMKSDIYGDDLDKLWPINREGQSDSACFDNALELLYHGGYSLAHAMMLMIPEAWAGNPLMDERRRAFYEYHAALMEPWDGPAAVAFTDGRQIGATLDRNGLRPARYLVTKDGHLVLASEAGVLDIAEENIVEKWRLQPGKMLLVDLEEGRIISDEELKRHLADAHPYQQLLDDGQLKLKELPDVASQAPGTNVPLLDRQQAFGYTQEDIRLLMAPMAAGGQEAIGSMGTDTPIPALSRRPRMLYDYFHQLFAQVTNPPIDPIREESVMSLISFIGPRPNLLGIGGATALKRLEISQPIISNEGLEKIRAIGDVAGN
ncbi:MAG TPA: glutamate synthase subunit alpha, partial [Thermopetrobacter sp.]|nr:glutamate synthase subunit alpha [Thermopetrobacter sp.]